MSLQNRFKKQAIEIVPVVERPEWLDIPAAAKHISGHIWTIRELIRNGKLPYQKVGRGFVIDRRDLDHYMEKNKIGIAA